MKVSMWKNGILLGAVIYFFLCIITTREAGAVVNDVVWKDVSSGIRDLDLQIVAISPNNADVVFVGSTHTIYKTTDGGKNWNEVLSFRGTGNTINSITIHPLNTEIVYAGTQDGLFRSKDNGMNWKRIFRGIGDLEGTILSVTINPTNPEVIFLGTRAGLFRTDNTGSDWRKSQNLPSEVIVSSIAIDQSKPHIIYAATDRGLYKSINDGIDWKRIFEASALENNSEDEYSISNEVEEVETEEAGVIKTKIRSIAIDPSDTETVYAGTSKGLLITEDGGLTWKMVSSSGLINRNIYHVITNPADPYNIYAATSRGVFRYSNVSESWLELYKGLTSADIRFLAFAPTIQDKSRTLWAVTKKGVFKTVEPNAASKNKKIEPDEVLSNFVNEPSIREIQEAAIRYAEVHPEKIEKWRKAAEKRAWLPDLTIGYDKDKDWQSSDYYYYGNNIGDDITEGKDWGWSISLTWELGDLIWNDDQTSIDTRSRLMVQLRDDVLNEVTRVYFERRRLQIDLLFTPPKEIKDKIEKELRLQELTADIDALTGFYLSKRLGRTE